MNPRLRISIRRHYGRWYAACPLCHEWNWFDTWRGSVTFAHNHIGAYHGEVCS